MSAKIIPNGCTFPTEFRDRTLYVHVGSKVITTELDVPGEAELSNVYFSSEKVFAYIETNDYKIILRFDETYTVYSKDWYVLSAGKFKLPNFEEQVKVFHKASFISHGEFNVCTLYCGTDESTEIIMTSPTAHGYMQMLLDNNSEFFASLGSPIEHMPVLYSRGIDKDTKWIGYDIDEGKDLFTIVGEWVTYKEEVKFI